MMLITINDRRGNNRREYSCSRALTIARQGKIAYKPPTQDCIHNTLHLSTSGQRYTLDSENMLTECKGNEG